MEPESEQTQGTGLNGGGGSGPEASTSGEALRPLRIEFTGNTREYCGIWLANIVLSIATLGIYSAWAKVRRSRYFLGNTIVLGDGLEYHATGKMILKGRLIAVGVMVVYYLISMRSPVAQIVVTIAFLPALPWVINRALKFQARMTSWRNIRFDWHGKYWGTARVYFLWPLIASFTLGVLAPMAVRATVQYLANNYALGRERFSATTSLREYYRAVLRGIALGLMLVAILNLPVAAISMLVGGSEAALFVLASLLPYNILVIILSAAASIRVLIRNIIISALTLGEAAGFRCDLSPLRFIWILVSNFFVTLFTLFLMYPWAHLRWYGFLAEGITVRATSAVEILVDSEAAAGGAFGEEFGEIEGIEFGV